MSTEREPSVLARLMGLDEIPIQRPVQKKPRVLSENYLCRVSSIGVRKKCSDQQAFKFSIEQHDEYKNVLQVLEKLSRKKHHTMTVVNAEIHLGSSELKRRNVVPKDKERKCFSRNGNCLSSQDPHDVHSNLQLGHLGMFKSSCDSAFMDIGNCCTFRRKSEIKFLNSPTLIRNSVGVRFSGECCTVNTGEFWRSIPNSRIVQKKDKKRSPNGTESVRPRFRKERTKIVGQGISTMFAVEPRSELSGSDYFAKEYDFSVGNYVVQDDQGNKLDKRFIGLSPVITQSSRKNNKTLQEACMKQKGQKNEVQEDDLIDDKVVVPKSPRSSFSINVEINGETQTVKKSPSNYDKHQSESINCIFSEKREESSLHIREALHVQEMFNGTFEEDSVSSQDTDPESESLISIEEACQPSPNSVLDILGKREISSTTDCFKSVNASLHGLHMQLELLKSKTSEAYHSVGSGMAVSSDDDNREGSVNESLTSPLRVEESRDFSYLVDILTEAGFQSRKKHNPKCPISYSVFETLEKKYGEQISWKRSERMLLFDRINLSLGEILQPFKGTVTRTKSVAKRLCYCNGDEMMEEGVWTLLVNGEEEVMKESEKMLGKDDRWMELGDVIEEIGREIEDSLIDELLADVY